MAKKEDSHLQWMENQLDSAQAEAHSGVPVKKYRAYNTDAADLDLDEYSRQVYQPKKRSLWKALFWLLLLAAVACAVYWFWSNGGIGQWQ